MRFDCCFGCFWERPGRHSKAGGTGHSVIGIFNRKRPAESSDKRIEFIPVDLRSETAIKSFVDHIKTRLERITVVHFAAKSIHNLGVQLPNEDWNEA